MEVGDDLIGMVKVIQNGYVRRSLIILQRIGQEVITSC